MPKLKNKMYELFARGRAKGLSQRLAGIQAGFTGKSSNMCRIEARAIVRDRIAELKVQMATEEKVTEATYVDAFTLEFDDSGANLKLFIHHCRLALARAVDGHDLLTEAKILHLMGCALGYVQNQASGQAPLSGSKTKGHRKQREKEAQEDHQNEQPRGVDRLSEGEIAELDQFIDQLGGGPGVEPEEAEAVVGRLAPDVSDEGGCGSGAEDGDDGVAGPDPGAHGAAGIGRDALPDEVEREGA